MSELSERLDAIKGRLETEYSRKADGAVHVYVALDYVVSDVGFLLESLEDQSKENTVLWIVAAGMIAGVGGSFDELERQVKDGIAALEEQEDGRE